MTLFEIDADLYELHNEVLANEGEMTEELKQRLLELGKDAEGRAEAGRTESVALVHDWWQRWDALHARGSP